ncbi:MAG: acyl-CoA thioesterase [Gemmobacter sp.]|nr:acyl-CoA thioesterase [Gemmobacter sp.]
MYPFARFAYEALAARKLPPLGLLDPHVSRHTCWPWDLDPWIELNNGRTLTLYDLGRIPFAMRTGIYKALRANKWGMTVAGNSVRYRRRVRAFQRFDMVSRCLGWDSRFIYLEQSMFRGGECTNQMLLRQAVTDKAGIVNPQRVLAAMGQDGKSPALPDWVQAWITADALRPWPPESTRLL